MLRRMSLATVGLTDRPPVVIAILHHISALKKENNSKNPCITMFALTGWLMFAIFLKKIEDKRATSVGHMAFIIG